MSLHKVPFTEILDLTPHPNADRLELATLYGFQVVVQKGKYKILDRVVFIPIDSVLPQWLEDKIFPPEDKGKQGKIQRNGDKRIRQIKIRKFPSQGMIIDSQDLQEKLGNNWWAKAKLEDDLAEKLEIIKYEPPYADHTPRGAQKRNRPRENPRFHKYNSVENIKWFPNLFKEGDRVVAQEKLHGTNCRASIQPAVANTLWKKIKKFFGRLSGYENCYGSNNVQLQERVANRGFYGKDVYGESLNRAYAFSKMKPGETIYGEVVGPGIQVGYDYGLKEHKFVLFDVKVTRDDGTQEFLNPGEAEAYAKERGFEFVPILFEGEFNKDILSRLSEGPSFFAPCEKVREGIVIKATEGYAQQGSKKALKWINPVYLENDKNTDLH